MPGSRALPCPIRDGARTLHAAPAGLRRLTASACLGLSLGLLLPATVQAEDSDIRPPMVAISDEAGDRYGSPGEDHAAGLIALPDGSFVLAGALAPEEEDGYPFDPYMQGWLLAFDRFGLPEWSRLLASTEAAEIYALAGLESGDLLAIGYSEDAAGGIRTAIHRFARDGALHWSALAGPESSSSFGVDALELPDGEILLGLEGNRGEEDGFAHIVRLSAGGQILWDRPIEGLSDLSGLFHLPGTGITAVGDVPGGGIRLVTIDEAGESGLLADLQVDSAIQAYRALPLPDGDIALAVSLSDDSDSPGAVLRTAPDGQVRWMRQITDGASWLESAMVAADGDLVVVGVLQDQEGEDAFIGRLAPDGTWRWAQRFDGPQDTQFFAVAQRADGTFLAAGSTRAREEGGDLGGEPRADAWLVALSAEGEPIALTEPVADPQLRSLAQEMRLASRSFLAGTAIEGTVLHEMAPPAFRQDGDTLVMATAPLLAGPVMLNVAHTRFSPVDADGVDAVTHLAAPLLQAQINWDPVRATVERQQIAWRYALGTYLPEAAALEMEGIDLTGPDGLRLAIARLDGRSRAEPQADGSWNLESRFSATGIGGGQAADPDAPNALVPPMRLAAERFDLTGETFGVDVLGYARAMDEGRTADLTSFARSVEGELVLRNLAYEDVDPDDGAARYLDVAAAGATFMMRRDSLDMPADLRVVYSLEGIAAGEQGEVLGTLGNLQLALTGTAIDLEMVRREFATIDLDRTPILRWDETEKLERMLRGIGGLGLQLTVTEIAMLDDTGGIDAALFELALDDIRDNAARLRLRLETDRLFAPPGFLPEAPDLEPQEIALDITLAPLPAVDMLTALLAGNEYEIPEMLALAAPVLEIARLALVTQAGEIGAEGSFAFDPNSPAMMTGKLDVTVVDMERLRRRLTEEAPPDEGMLIGGFGGALDALARRSQTADGRTASHFAVEAQPDGTITVNGTPFPMED